MTTWWSGDEFCSPQTHKVKYPCMVPILNGIKCITFLLRNGEDLIPDFRLCTLFINSKEMTIINRENNLFNTQLKNNNNIHMNVI
jgi:hypothetical protein